MKTGDRIAVISDVHGNRWALEAVLADIDARGVDRIVDLGDTVYGPLDPAGTAEILMARGILSVRGNEDRIITDWSKASEESTTLEFVREQIELPVVKWLEAMPMIGTTETTDTDAVMFHGTPRRDTDYLLRSVTATGLRPRSSEELTALLGNFGQSLVLCGHDHTPGEARLSDGRLIVNPGSVGLPAYTDDFPLEHVVETGTPHARYAVLTRSNSGWRTEFVAVEYDWDRAAREALTNGRPDWSVWLRTGRT